MSLAVAFVPIWLLVAAGYAARRWPVFGRQLFSDRLLGLLSWFVFHVAMPAALFVTLARTSLAGFDLRPVAAFAVSTALMIGSAWYLAWRIFDRKPGERAIWAMSAGYVNSANLGIPVALQVIGNLTFLVQVVLVQVLVVAPIILAVLDRHADGGGQFRVRRFVTLPLRNPVILASALGIAAGGAHVTLPIAVHDPLAVLAWAAVPLALLTLGASLYRPAEPSQTGRAEITTIAALKLAAQPAVAFVASLLLGLTPAQMLAVVVCAGLPTAQNVFVFARQYSVGEALASRSVLITTTLSLASIATIAALLR